MSILADEVAAIAMKLYTHEKLSGLINMNDALNVAAQIQRNKILEERMEKLDSRFYDLISSIKSLR